MIITADLYANTDFKKLSEKLFKYRELGGVKNHLPKEIVFFENDFSEIDLCLDDGKQDIGNNFEPGTILNNYVSFFSYNLSLWTNWELDDNLDSCFFKLIV